jgi:hypothetical protein
VPWHAPPTHVWFVQVTGEPHAPALLQVCTPLPLHCVCPGAQTPRQTPPMHVWLVHATATPHVPFAPQVCTPFPEHWTAPGLHSTQALLKQTGVDPEHADCVFQLPLASHV